MELTESRMRVLEWIATREPVIGVFHVMTDIAPMIAHGLVEQKKIAPAQRQLMLTDDGRAALERFVPH
jgi:hypothetical protein